MTDVVLKVKAPTGLTFEQVMSQSQQGGKFIAYQYLLPRPFYPVKRISKIYYIDPSGNGANHAFRYNLMTLLWGWWGLPFGPFYTYTIIKNNKSGIDFTEDIYVNLTKEDFEKGLVSIKKVGSAFIHPDKTSLKEFTKCFKKFSETNTGFEANPIVGKYIDTESPYFVIGLSDKDYERKEEIKGALYKRFYAHIPFVFLNMDEANELTEKLKKQGIEMTSVNRASV